MDTKITAMIPNEADRIRPPALMLRCTRTPPVQTDDQFKIDTYLRFLKTKKTKP